MGRFIKLNRLVSINEGQKGTTPVYINTDCIAYVNEDNLTWGFKVTRVCPTHGYIDVTEDVDEVMSMIHNQNRR